MSVHWARPDIAGDIVAVAVMPAAAPPREIRIRPALYERVLARMAADDRAAVEQTGRLGRAPGIPVVLDPGLPLFPGFEVVRARPEQAAA
jgi:hypothetical protein